MNAWNGIGRKAVKKASRQCKWNKIKDNEDYQERFRVQITGQGRLDLKAGEKRIELRDWGTAEDNKEQCEGVGACIDECGV